MKALQELLPLVGKRAPTHRRVLTAPEPARSHESGVELDQGALGFPEEDAFVAADEEIGNRRSRRALTRARARAEGFVLRHPRLAHLDFWKRLVCSIVVTALRDDRAASLSTTFLMNRVADRTGRMPTYHCVVTCLDELARVGFIRWQKAHPCRSGGKIPKDDPARPTLYPSPRFFRPGQRAALASRSRLGKAPPGVLPCRRIHATGEVGRILQGRHPDGSTARVAIPIEPVPPERSTSHRGSIDPPEVRPPGELDLSGLKSFLG